MSGRPPPWAVWLLVTLVPRRHRVILADDLLEQYRDRLRPAQDRQTANRWFLAQVAQYAWAASHLAVLVVLISFLVGDGLHVELPRTGSTFRAWFIHTGPALTLGAVGAWTGWRAGAWASLISGLIASCLGTAAILVLTTVTLAIANPQLMKIGMSWESLRDLASILGHSTLTGTAVSAMGGVLGAWANRAGSLKRLRAPADDQAR